MRERLLFLHIELAIYDRQRNVVVALGVVHDQVVITSFQMLGEQITRVLMLERLVDCVITANGSVSEADQGMRGLLGRRIRRIFLNLRFVEHLLHRVTLVRRMLYVRVIVAIGMLLGLIEVRIQIQHHQLSRLLAVYMIVHGQLLERCLALIQLFVSLGLMIFVVVATVIRRLERTHVCRVEFDAAQGRRVFAAEKLRLRLVFGAGVRELIRRLPKIIV